MTSNEFTYENLGMHQGASDLLSAENARKELLGQIEEAQANDNPEAVRFYESKLAELQDKEQIGDDSSNFLGSYSSYSDSDLQSKLKSETRAYQHDIERASQMAAENARGVVYNAKNLISDRTWSAKSHMKEIQSIQDELRKRG